MTIKEIEEQSGMSWANVRFYEAEGLLMPRRSMSWRKSKVDSEKWSGNSLTNTSQIEIIDQNFGFDRVAGIDHAHWNCHKNGISWMWQFVINKIGRRQSFRGQSAFLFLRFNRVRMPETKTA